MSGWLADRLLPGFEQLEIPLPDAERMPGETDALVATLVRRNPPERRRAMLYLHGWSDYFFQAHLADRMALLGFDFHAIDLRRYGRSLRPGQLAGYIADLDEYATELDAALAELRRDHDEVTLMAHSTGGLVGSLWADSRPGELHGLVLNSPWLVGNRATLLEALAGPVVRRVGGRHPTAVIKVADTGFYGRTIDADLDGEWRWDRDLKGAASFQPRLGWMRAILAGHERVAKGLAIDTPVLACTSARSDFRRTWDDSLAGVDVVLDAARIAERAVRLGPCVTVVKVDGGLHDLALSAEAAREEYFRAVERWGSAYL